MERSSNRESAEEVTIVEADLLKVMSATIVHRLDIGLQNALMAIGATSVTSAETLAIRSETVRDTLNHQLLEV